jgi:hypothetical protein
MTSQKPVHRPLALHSPRLHGDDVHALQGSINKQYAHLKIDREIQVDGVLGGETFEAAKEVAACLGACGHEQDKLHRHVLAESLQKLIRGRKRTAGEEEAAHRRADYRKTLRDRYAKSPGEDAIAKALKLVGVHEEPAGSNWGGKVEDFILFTGYNGPVYWCGCFACWVVVKLGGADIPNQIRMGYALYITADALAGTNGFTAVSVHQARPGDVGCLWNGEHVVTIRESVKPGDTMVKTIEGNTSASDGSQSNGGEVALKERPIGDFDRGIVARPAWS